MVENNSLKKLNFASQEFVFGICFGELINFKIFGDLDFLTVYKISFTS